MMAEIERLMDGFKTHIGASSRKCDLMEMRRMFSKPEWIRAPDRTVSPSSLLNTAGFRQWHCYACPT